MRCQRCNSHIPNDSLYCKKCGQKVMPMREYRRSKPMKRTMTFIFVSLGLFAAGMFLSIAVPPVGLAILIPGGICLVISSCIYLFQEYRHEKKMNDPVYYETTSLSQEPVYLRRTDDFIYPDMFVHVPNEYQKVVSAGSDNFLVDVCYQGKMVMQFINVPDVTKGETENIGIFFYPYLYDDRALIERFADNYYMYKFDNTIYSDEGTAAYFGKDIRKAMIVATYILATVYYIPLDAQLTIRVDAC